MAANTIRRIHKPGATHVAPDVVLNFTDGLEVHPADCPRGIQAYPHWQPGANGRAICKCTVLAAETATDGGRCDECDAPIALGHLCTRCRRREDRPYEPLDEDAFGELMATGYADDEAEF